MGDAPLIDKTFDGMIRQMRRNITELQRRLGSLSVLPLPEVTQLFAPSTATVTAAAATWGAFSPTVEHTITPSADLEVVLTYSSNIVGNGAVYGMVGVRCSGGLNLEPDYDQVSGTQKFGTTPFSTVAENVTVFGSKKVVIPGGVPTTFTLLNRRNTAAFTPSTNYAMMMISPRRWV